MFVRTGSMSRHGAAWNACRSPLFGGGGVAWDVEEEGVEAEGRGVQDSAARAVNPEGPGLGRARGPGGCTEWCSSARRILRGVVAEDVWVASQPMFPKDTPTEAERGQVIFR